MHERSRTHSGSSSSTGGDVSVVLQRKCACGNHTVAGGECAQCSNNKRSLQRATRNSDLDTQNSNSVPAVVHDVLRASGQPIDKPTRAFFESRLGHDFSHVRVHTDAPAAESARALNAHAYTVGKDVVFGASQYAPGTLAGRKLLAHELTHVVQQASGSPALQRSPGPTDDPLEREADRKAQSAAGESPSFGALGLTNCAERTADGRGCRKVAIGANAPGSTAKSEEAPNRDPSLPGQKLPLTGLRSHLEPGTAKPEAEKPDDTPKPISVPVKPVLIHPPPQKIPAALMKAAAEKAGKTGVINTAAKANFKVMHGGPFGSSTRETAVGPEGEFEAGKEKRGAAGLSFGVYGSEAGLTLEGKLVGKFPIAELVMPGLAEKLKRVMTLKEMKVGFGVETKLGSAESLTSLAGELTINVFSLTLENKRRTIVGEFNLNLLGKLGGAPGEILKLEGGAEASGALKWMLDGGPLYVSIQLDFKVLASKDGGDWSGAFTLTPILSAGGALELPYWRRRREERRLRLLR